MIDTVSRAARWLIFRLTEIFHHPGGWEWAAIIVGAVELSRGILVVLYGESVLHPGYPLAAQETVLTYEARRWVFLVLGGGLMAGAITGRLVVVRVFSMASVFILISTSLVYLSIPPPYRLYIQGTTQAILAVAAALVYVAAGDAKSIGK